MLVCMASTRGLDPFPSGPFDGYPLAIRQAAGDLARSGAALRLYRRRGWNDSAVHLQRNRDSVRLIRLLDEYGYYQNNPPLF